jgi:hypothetical protein
LPADGLAVPGVALSGLSAEQIDILSLIPTGQRGVFDDSDEIDLDSLRFLADDLLRSGFGKVPDGEGGFVPVTLGDGKRSRPEPRALSPRERQARQERGLALRRQVVRSVERSGGRIPPSLRAQLAGRAAALCVGRARLVIDRIRPTSARPRGREHRAARRTTRAASRGSRGDPPGEPEPPSDGRRR